jgi:hypothetical protein
MTEKTLSPDPMQDGEEEKPLRYWDCIDPNPYVMPWMSAYLPKNWFLVDLIFALGGTAAGLMLGIVSHLVFGQFGEYIGVAVFVLFITFFQGDFRARYYTAGIKYRREKKKRELSTQ